MRKFVTALAVILITTSAFALQTKPAKPPAAKPARAAAVDCSSMDDAALASSVKDKLAKTPSLKDAAIDVTASAGTVTLKGTLDKPALKGVATNQAKRVACVKKVDNQITVPKTPAAPRASKNKNGA